MFFVVANENTFWLACNEQGAETSYNSDSNDTIRIISNSLLSRAVMHSTSPDYTLSKEVRLLEKRASSSNFLLL